MRQPNLFCPLDFFVFLFEGCRPFFFPAWCVCLCVVGAGHSWCHRSPSLSHHPAPAPSLPPQCAVLSACRRGENPASMKEALSSLRYKRKDSSSKSYHTMAHCTCGIKFALLDGKRPTPLRGKCRALIPEKPPHTSKCSSGKSGHIPTVDGL